MPYAAPGPQLLPVSVPLLSAALSSKTPPPMDVVPEVYRSCTACTRGGGDVNDTDTVGMESDGDMFSVRYDGGANEEGYPDAWLDV